MVRIGTDFGSEILFGPVRGTDFGTEPSKSRMSGPRNEIRTGPDFRYGTASHVLKRLTAVKIYRGSI